jgi:fumarylacetoacetase
MYWTFAQQLAHMTVNGATIRAGDYFASGTVSGPTPAERGSLIEQIADGTASGFLADGDTVTLRGRCGAIGFGEATGTVVGGT